VILAIAYTLLDSWVVADSSEGLAARMPIDQPEG